MNSIIGKPQLKVYKIRRTDEPIYPLLVILCLLSFVRYPLVVILCSLFVVRYPFFVILGSLSFICYPLFVIFRLCSFARYPEYFILRSLSFVWYPTLPIYPTFSSRCVLDTMRFIDLLLLLMFEGRNALPRNNQPTVTSAASSTDSANHKQLIDRIRSKDSTGLIELMETGYLPFICYYLPSKIPNSIAHPFLYNMETVICLLFHCLSS